MNVKLENVRLSYPNLFEAKSGPEGGEPKYSASLLLSKQENAGQIKQMQDGILAAAKAQWGDDKVKWHNGQLVVKKPDGKAGVIKVCLRDGSEKPDTDGYGDAVMFFSASNKMAPAVVVSEEESRPSGPKRIRYSPSSRIGSSRVRASGGAGVSPRYSASNLSAADASPCSRSRASA